MQVNLALCLMFVIAGAIIFVFAEELSKFERRLVEKFPATRITGWSGTRKGTNSWRLVGLLLALLGVFFTILPLVLLHR
jgi:hypothetical protein